MIKVKHKGERKLGRYFESTTKLETFYQNKNEQYSSLILSLQCLKQRQILNYGNFSALPIYIFFKNAIR